MTARGPISGPTVSDKPDLSDAKQADGPSPTQRIVDRGDRPGREQSLAEESTAREDEEVSLKPDGTNPAEAMRLGAADLTGAEDDAGDSLFLGKDRPSESELAEGLIGGASQGGGAGGSEGGAGGSAVGTTGSSGQPPVDPGPPPDDSGGDAPYGGKESMIGADVHTSGGAPFQSSGGELSGTTKGQQELAKEYGNTWLGDTANVFNSAGVGAAGQQLVESGWDGSKTSSDGVVTVRVNENTGATEVTNKDNNTKTVLNKDGSSTTTNLTTGEKIDETDALEQPDPDNEGADIPEEMRRQILDEAAALRQHRGSQHDAGTETQPVDGDAAFSGTGPVGSTAAVPDAKGRLLGDPVGPDDDFGTGGGGSANNPDDGAIDWGPDADTTPQTQGPEDDPFGDQQDIEPAADTSTESDDTDAAFGAGELAPVSRYEGPRELSVEADEPSSPVEPEMVGYEPPQDDDYGRSSHDDGDTSSDDGGGKESETEADLIG